MDRDKSLRKHLVELLNGGSAHVRFEDVVADWPEELQGVRPESAAHSAWEVIEHLRICQWDILDFSRNPSYRHKKWPDEYWPQTTAPPDRSSWGVSISRFQQDLQAMKDLVLDPKKDLFEAFLWGDGQTLLREAMLAADHNAYHLGELVVIKRTLGID